MGYTKDMSVPCPECGSTAELARDHDAHAFFLECPRSSCPGWTSTKEDEEDAIMLLLRTSLLTPSPEEPRDE